MCCFLFKPSFSVLHRLSVVKLTFFAPWFLNPSCEEFFWGVDDLPNVIFFLTFLRTFCVSNYWLLYLFVCFVVAVVLSVVINFCAIEFQSLLLSTVFGVECHLFCTNVDLKRLMEKHAKFYHEFPFFPREHCRKTIIPCRIQHLKLYEDSCQLHALK